MTREADHSVNFTAGHGYDLANNRPGQAARLQAGEELVRMRERSRILAAMLRFFDAKTDERAWRVGTKGEEAVGDRLNALVKRNWRVLHSVPIGKNGADIDHLLIGPGGVWTLNTKSHPDKKVWVGARQIRVGGQPVPYLRNSEFEATRVRRILAGRLGWEPFVKPALVILTGTLLPQVKIKQMPEKVLVLDRLDVPRVFLNIPTRLSEAQVDEVYAVARRSTTWVS